MNGHNARKRYSSKIDRSIAANDGYLSETVACSLADTIYIRFSDNITYPSNHPRFKAQLLASTSLYHDSCFPCMCASLLQLSNFNSTFFSLLSHSRFVVSLFLNPHNFDDVLLQQISKICREAHRYTVNIKGPPPKLDQELILKLLHTYTYTSLTLLYKSSLKQC